MDSLPPTPSSSKVGRLCIALRSHPAPGPLQTNMTFTLFEPGIDAKKGTQESIDAQTSKLKSAASLVSAPKATTINLSTTSQPGLGVDAVVIAAQDGNVTGSPVLRLLVATVRVDKNGGGADCYSFDSIGDTSIGPLITPTRQLANNTGNIISMPRVIAEPGVDFGASPLLATPILSVCYFKNSSKDGAELNAVNIIPGTRVKLSGVSFEHPRPNKATNVEPAPRARIKRIDVISKPDSPTKAAKALKDALESTVVESYTAMSVVASLGGIEKIGEIAPLLASDLARAQRDLRHQTAAGLRSMATRLESVVAGDGESYASLACKPESRSALLAMADKLESASITAPLSMILGSPVELPLIFPGHDPSSLTPIMDTPTKLSKAPVYARARISSTSVDVQDGKGTGVLTIYPTITLSLSGDRALLANGAEQPAYFNYNADAVPTCAIKYSLKNFAPMLGTCSLKKTTMAARELVSYAPLTVSTNLYPRSGEDAIFGDKSGGSNWANIFDMDLRGALNHAALPVRIKFVQEEYCAGEATISEYEPDDTDRIAPPGSNALKPPTLDTTGVLAISEKTRKLSKLVDEYPGLIFFAVVDGAAEAIKKAPELLTDHSKAEGWLKAKLGGSSPTETEKSLIANTLLFAVKPLVNTTPEASEDDVKKDEDLNQDVAETTRKKAKKSN